MRSRSAGRWKVGTRSVSLIALALALEWFGCVGDPDAEAQAIPRIDAARAFRDLERQVAIGTRVPGTKPHRETRDYLLAELKKTTPHVRLQPFQKTLGGKPVEMWNLIASYGDPNEAGIVLCAHWDTRPTADHDPDPAKRNRPIPGANDGASGVAVLLEIGRQFKTAPPPGTVHIVLFDGEDYGPGAENMFLGSTHYAKNPLPKRPQYAILIDMIGDRDLSIPMEALSYRAAPALMTAIWDIARDMGVAAFVRRMGAAVYDDHVPLIENGIPAIDLIDFDYPYWHTLADTPDKCSPNSLAAVGDVLLRYVYTR